MSMTREEAIVQIQGLKEYCENMADSDESGAYVFDLDVQALDLALTALRGPTREMVEKMRGEWVPYGFDKRGRGGIWHCTQCSKSYPVQNTFCPYCGAPMTDEAVSIMLRRWKEAVDVETQLEK